MSIDSSDLRRRPPSQRWNPPSCLVQLSPLGNRERCVAIASAGPNIAPPGGNDVTLAVISQDGVAVILSTLGTDSSSTGSSLLLLLPFPLLVGNEVRWLANEGQEMRNGPRLGARVAGMAPKVRKAALDAALRALVLSLAFGCAEDDIKVWLAYKSTCRRR